MPSANKTANGLNLWVETDTPIMEDFNEDNERVDEIVEEVQQTVQYNSTVIEHLQSTKANINDVYTKNQVDEQMGSWAPVTAKRFSIPVSAWVSSNAYADYPLEATLSAQDILVRDNALLFFDAASVLVAQEAGVVNGIGDTVTGGIKIYAKEKPEEALSGTYTTIKGEQ